MRTQTLAGLLLCGMVAGLGALPTGCNSDGELVVVVRSEIRIDGVAYEILRDGVVVERRCALLSETSSGGLPASISVTGAAGTAITVRVIGLVGSTCDQSAGFDPSSLGDIAVLREIITTIPAGRSATLDVLFAKSCGREDGAIVADGVGEFDDTVCAAGTTCIDAADGSCESSTVDSSTLPDYSEGDLGTGGSGFGGSGGVGGAGGSGAGGGAGGGGGGGGGECTTTTLFSSGVRRIAAVPSGVDAIYHVNSSEVKRWEGGAQVQVPYGSDPNAILDIAAARAGSSETIVIANGTLNAMQWFTYDGSFIMQPQQGLQVSEVAAGAPVSGLTPLWTEGDLQGEASHWIPPGMSNATPLGSGLGTGTMIEASGHFAAVAFQTPSAESRLEIVDLGGCTTLCTPDYSTATGVNSLSVGEIGGQGVVAWTADTGALFVFTASNGMATSLGGNHKLVALDLQGHTAVIDAANVLRTRTGGFVEAPDCTINLPLNPLRLVQTVGATYVLLQGGQVLRVAAP